MQYIDGTTGSTVGKMCEKNERCQHCHLNWYQYWYRRYSSNSNVWKQPWYRVVTFEEVIDGTGRMVNISNGTVQCQLCLKEAFVQYIMVYNRSKDGTDDTVNITNGTVQWQFNDTVQWHSSMATVVVYKMVEKGGRVPPAACLVLSCPLCRFFLLLNCCSSFSETFAQLKSWYNEYSSRCSWWCVWLCLGRLIDQSWKSWSEFSVKFWKLCKSCTTTRMFKLDVTHLSKVVPTSSHSNVSSNDEASWTQGHFLSFWCKKFCWILYFFSLKV